MTKLIYDKTCIISKCLHFLIGFFRLESWAARSSLDYQVTINSVQIRRTVKADFKLNVLHLSDIHIESIPDQGKKLTEKLRTLEFDLVVLTGDYKLSRCGSDQNTIDLLIPLLKSLKCKHGIYAVQGNHDTPNLMQRLVKENVTVLNNENVKIKFAPHCALNIAGISDPHYWQQDDLSKAFAHCDEAYPTLLLAHSAEKAEQAEHFPLDLYLCGHSHGGQICAANRKPIMNNARCSRKYIAGVWNSNFLQGYTSRGVGTTGYPVRVQCPPEIVIHRLFNE